MASFSFASPFLVCDPQAGVTLYKVTGPIWIPVSIPAQPDGSIKLDVAAANIGNNSLTIKACKQDELWGELCSDAVPFVFIKPLVAVPPANMKLSK